MNLVKVFLLLILAVIIFLGVCMYHIRFACSEGMANIKDSQHLGFGAWPPSLYGEEPSNKYYSEDLKSAMRYSDRYGMMAGNKFPSYDINDYLKVGKHGGTKVNTQFSDVTVGDAVYI